MTNYKHLPAIVATLFGALLTLVGCTTEVDYGLGSEFVPTNQQMEMRRRVYSLGEVRESGTTESCALASMRLYRTDSIVSSNLENIYFGREQSDTFGMRTAGFMSQILFNMTIDEKEGWGYRPIFDSMQLSLHITDFHGDTTIKQRFEVYEIISNDYIALGKHWDRDTTFFINFDPTPYIAKEPIFTFEFPDQEAGVYVGDITNPENRTVTLRETPHTRDYVERLMLTSAMDENDGYAVDSEGIYVEGNEAKFVEQIRGLYITPVKDESSHGAMYATSTENSGVMLYARNRYKEDPTIIKDTVYMGYNFYIDPKLYNTKAGNVSINTVKHDYSAVSLYDSADFDSELPSAERREVVVGYVDGMGGVISEVTLSDELIQSLADVVLSRADATISVNQAHLSIYLEGSDYDYMAISPSIITPILDGSMPRLGLYTDYSKKIAVTDYAYASEGSYSLAYDGYLNRSLACYTMDISTYIQSLMIAAADNLLEDGRTVDLAKFREDYEPQSESLVNLRRFYVGPAADSYFGFNHEAIIGGESSLESGHKAPIKLEITYTIVN